jgi:hypothetical protein
VLRTFALKPYGKHGERDDHERRKTPPAPRWWIYATIQTAAGRNLPTTALAFREFVHAER